MSGRAGAGDSRELLRARIDRLRVETLEGFRAIARNYRLVLIALMLCAPPWFYLGWDAGFLPLMVGSLVLFLACLVLLGAMVSISSAIDGDLLVSTTGMGGARRRLVFSLLPLFGPSDPIDAMGRLTASWREDAKAPVLSDVLFHRAEIMDVALFCARRRRGGHTIDRLRLIASCAALVSTLLVLSIHVLAVTGNGATGTMEDVLRYFVGGMFLVALCFLAFWAGRWLRERRSVGRHWEDQFDRLMETIRVAETSLDWPPGED
jgi:hypothetical protein